MPGRVRRRYTTFLVSVTAERPGKKSPGPTVYAVMKPSAEEAVGAVRAVADPRSTIAVVGSLSTRIAKALKLEPDELRAV
jgi:hypothetical protein